MPPEDRDSGSDPEERFERLSDLPLSAKIVYKVLELEGPLTQAGLADETRLAGRTLHHVLLDRLTQEPVEEAPARQDSPPVELVEAFKTHDAGRTTFTISQLEAIQAVVASYHHAPTWEVDRSQLEQLLGRVTIVLEQWGTVTATD